MENRLQSPAPEAPTEAVTYRLVVASPEEAVRTLREKFGDRVEVVSVRAIAAPGLRGMLGAQRFEVLARPSAPIAPAATSGKNGKHAAEALYASSDEDDATEEEDATFAPDSTAAPATAAPAETPFSFNGMNARSRPVAAPGFGEILRRAGFSERTLAILGEAATRAQANGQTTHRSLIAFGEALRRQLAQRPERPLPRKVAFLGSAGAGRTTAVGKWLGRTVFETGQLGRIFRVELDEPNRAEGLDLLCEALGLLLEHCGPDGIGQPKTADFEFYHTPALSLSRPQDNHALGRFLDREGIEGRVLVLHAAYDATVQRAILRAGRDLGATHLVFTHVDEAIGWGRLWEPLLESDLTPLFLSLSPSLTGGFDLKVVDRLLAKTLPGF